jgi:hypothetical protein
MPENPDIRKLTPLPVLAGAAVVGTAAILSVRAAVPTIDSPFAILPTLFAFLVFDMRMFDGDRMRGLAHILAASPVAILFLVWNVQLFRREVHVPRRSIALYLVAVVLSAAFFALAWNEGVLKQGLTHTAVLVLFNVLFALLVGFTLTSNRRSPAYASNLAFHVILFSWFSWCAFPWLGEVI